MGDDHLHDHFHNHGDDPEDFIANLPVEMREQWPRVLRELTELAARVKDVHVRANPEPLPKELDHVQKARLLKSLRQAVLADDRPGLKRSVAQRVANKIGNYFLWNRVPSVPVIHELAALSPWWIDNMAGEVISRLRDISLYYILSGRVVPLQKVWTEVLDAEMVYMGHCVCRSSGIANDKVDGNGKMFTLTTPEQNRLLLDRLVNRYQDLKETHGRAPDTDGKYVELFERLLTYRAEGSSLYKLETFLDETWGEWEILPVVDGYTQSWVRGMHKNHKAHRLHKSLVFDFATILYLSRGSLFTAMKLIDTPYTICTCPTPETGGGCVLTNWYYHGHSNTSIRPSDECHGRRRDEKGEVLPCRMFPQRQARGCMGCGCDHEKDSPRSVETVLAQADRLALSHPDVP